ncbi:PAS domain S-box-containing protein [Neobacillus niacini]|uniref:sigma-54 interaction domain-containing protein n=1 Tax=Neobacillus niacini TaxID=86668 RepID=UPI00286432A2|nr:sigma 54-interacting transcriptional regulator [Neobacillus niacini]MDR7076069.1 PAS domain S-box-containing protein [Neobacillus niacini]
MDKLSSTELQAIFDACSEGVFVIDVIDHDFIGLWANQAFEKITGLSHEFLSGRSLHEAVKEGRISDIISGKIIEEKQAVSKLQAYRNGKTALITGRPIFKGNEVVKIVGTARDVTEINKLVEELKRNQELSEQYKQELEDLKVKEAIKNKIVYSSSKMEKVIELAIRVSKVKSSVLLSGESGVGKDVIANLIHKSSSQKEKPFVEVNCGAIPKELIESELFGYESGAFTGAKREGKPGLFELANGGTIFLDEIGEMPLNMQVKLLRVIQNLKVHRIGGTKPISLDIRIIAATNKDLEQMVINKEFREDLYYRLSVIPIDIPSLRDRKEDISLLCYHFLKYYNEKHNKDKYFHYNLIEPLENHDWPGNVRELQNLIERLVVLTEEQCVKQEHLPLKYRESDVLLSDKILDKPLKEIVESLEKEVIMNSLKKYRTAVSAAKKLGLSQPTMSRKMNYYNLKEHKNKKIQL